MASVTRGPLFIRPKLSVNYLATETKDAFLLQVPLPLRAPAATNFQDGAGSAIADAETRATWSGTDKYSTVTISGNELTTTLSSGGGAAYFNAKGSRSLNSGKYYFEYVPKVQGSADTIGMGLCEANFQLGNDASFWVGSGTGGAESIGIFSASGVVLNSVGQAALTWSVNDVIRIAVDITGRLAWFRVNTGNWNNNGSADPATGVGGIDISSLAGPIYPATSLWSTNDQVAAAFNEGETTYTPPTGFSYWGVNYNATSLADSPGTATGDAIASAVDGSDRFPFDVWTETWLRRGPSKAVKLGRGAQVEFGQPLTLETQSYRVTDGTATGDATADATGAPLADGDGAASGDATASATGDSTVFPFDVWKDTRQIRVARAVKLGRGAQIEFQSPITLTGPQATFGDGAGAATGDAIASGDGNSLADGVASASGDATASATGDSTVFPFDVWKDTRQIRVAKAVKLGRGSQVEFGQPLPCGTQSIRTTDGTATGDAIASATGDSLADSVATATGDATASASSDPIIFPFDVWKDSRQIRVAKSPKLGRGAQIEFQVGLPILFANASQGAGTAQGDANASAVDGSIYFPFATWEESKNRRGPSRAVKLGRGAQIEFQTAFPLQALVFDGVGSAIGDAEAGALGRVLRRVHTIQTTQIGRRTKTVVSPDTAIATEGGPRSTTDVGKPKPTSGVFDDNVFDPNVFDASAGVTMLNAVTNVRPPRSETQIG